MKDDFELEPETYTPPSSSRVQTLAQLNSRVLTIGDKLTLIDGSWLHLFPEYRSVGECVVTLLVAEVLPDQQYRLGISDIVPVVGTIKIPAGINAVRTLPEIQKAMVLSGSLRNEIPDSEGRKQSGFRVDYDALMAQFEQSNTAILSFPETVRPSHIRSSVHTTLRRHGVYTTTKIDGNNLILTRTKEPVRPKKKKKTEPGNI